jgi:hypothetical protein
MVEGLGMLAAKDGNLSVLIVIGLLVGPVG